jgi:hypothetical protein
MRFRLQHGCGASVTSAVHAITYTSGAVTVLGSPVDLGKITVDSYVGELGRVADRALGRGCGQRPRGSAIGGTSSWARLPGEYYLEP